MGFDVFEKGFKGVADTSKGLAKGGFNLSKEVAQDGCKASCKFAGHATSKAAGWAFDTTKDIGSGAVKGTGSLVKSGANSIKAKSGGSKTG